MNEKIKFTYRNYSKQTIHDFLIKKGYSDNNIFYLIKNGNILINQIACTSKNEILHFNNVIQVTLNDEFSDIPVWEENINVVYEDNYLLIVYKEKDLEIEPSRYNYNHTLVNKVLYYFQTNNIFSKVHLINRLDKVTEGLVLIAKNQYIHHLFSKVKIEKKYIALLQGHIQKKGAIKIKIAKDSTSTKRIVNEKGKLAITKYKLIKYINDNSLVDVQLLTGRTHQIRLSFSSIGFPLVGDSLYNPKIDNQPFLLKAYYINFTHPITKKSIIISF